MSLNDEELTEFQQIWKEDYGQEITKEEAREYAQRLLDFFMILIEIDGSK